jgi:hypothetical protein
MTALSWDGVGDRTYETGVDHGVLYTRDGAGAYTNGFAWNGLTTITESPSGAEANPMYADNIKYLNLYSAEEFGATLEAFTFPDEFLEYDGLVVPVAGVAVGQQARKTFGLSYRTKKGNDVDGEDFGYKIHLIYGASASPSEKAYNTVNDSPEAITFSWEITTTPVGVTDMRPTSIVTIDSTLVDAGDLEDLETILYGSMGVDPRLPLPDEVISIFTTGLTGAIATMPTFNASTGVVTIPTVTGVVYTDADGDTLTAGAQTAIAADAYVTIKAKAATGYFLSGGDDDWVFHRDP